MLDEGMVRLAALTLTALVAGTVPAPRAAPDSPPPVVFVHGMGASAADMGVPPAPGAPAPFGALLTAIADTYPYPGVCQDAAQPGRPWDGSPCVFRYVDDAAGADEGLPGPNDSQSGVRENAGKLAGEVAEVAANAGRRVVLLGYSMGGAIIRTYLAMHTAEAERDVAGVVLVDAVTQGSWGFAAVGEIPKRVPGPLGQRLMLLLRSMAAGAAAVDFDRPAPNDLRPRSALYREITARPVPSGISYATFWGDIRIAVRRSLLVYDLPTSELPSMGDLGLLPGDPDPSALPELGGQRFTPAVDPGREALDVPHTVRIELAPEVIRTLIDACGHRPPPGAPGCTQLLAGAFEVPNEHTSVALRMPEITVEHDAFGGRVTLVEAILTVIGRAA